MNALITKRLKELLPSEDYLAAFGIINEWDAKLKGLLDDEMILAAIAVSGGGLDGLRECSYRPRDELIREQQLMEGKGEQSGGEVRS